MTIAWGACSVCQHHVGEEPFSAIQPNPLHTDRRSILGIISPRRGVGLGTVRSSSLVYFRRPSTARMAIPGEDESPRTDRAETSEPEKWLVFSASREPVGISPFSVTGR